MRFSAKVWVSVLVAVVVAVFLWRSYATRLPDYPRVTYPGPGTMFSAPDLKIAWDEFAFSQTEPLELPEVEVPKLSAQMEFQVSVGGTYAEEWVHLNVDVITEQDRPVTGGSGALFVRPGTDPTTAIVSFLGPARPGKYIIRVRIVESHEKKEESAASITWKTLGIASCTVLNKTAVAN